MTIRSFLLFGLAVPLAAFAADPTASESLTLTRTLEQGLELRTELTKNIFRIEPYQAEYSVDVPYQDTETYTESVPYTESVQYTDYETYYDNEYRCHNVTDYRQECHSERVCHMAGPFDPPPGYPGGPIPPGYPHPGFPSPPVSVPTPQPPPPPPPPREPVCSDVQRCNNVPVTRQECGNESVQKQRPVTRYRDETRYRNETRTRQVTRYRSETRCCVTRERSVFDHQQKLPVLVRFPAEAVLLAGEKESFRLDLQGSESQPDVAFAPLKTVFGYAVAAKDVKPGSATIDLALKPKFAAGTLTIATIKNLRLEFTSAGAAEVRFDDSFREARVATAYEVEINEKGSDVVIAKHAATAGAATAVVIPITEALAIDREMQVRLKIVRTGEVIEGGQVSLAANADYSGKLDLAVQRDNGKIGGLAVEGHGADAVLVFFDKAPAHPQVKTTYKISTSRKSSGGSVYMQDKSIDRASLSTGADGSYRIAFRDLGVSAANLGNYFKAGGSVTVSLEVFRSSGKFSGKISLWKGATLPIK